MYRVLINVFSITDIYIFFSDLQILYFIIFVCNVCNPAAED